MRRSTTAIFAAVTAVPLAFLAAGTAAADPGEIDANFTTTVNPDGLGNTVTGTFTATGDNLPVLCAMVDTDNVGTGPFDYLLDAQSSEMVPRGITVSDITVPDGTYTIEWYCSLANGAYDGTKAYVANSNYSDPTTLVVPEPTTEEPEVPDPICTGSACLPTGSFGL